MFSFFCFFARSSGATPLRRFAERIVLAFGLHADTSFSSLLIPASSTRGPRPAYNGGMQPVIESK
jgi:hypothetical protein